VIRELRQQGISLRLGLEWVEMARATFYRPGGGNPAEERLRARIQELAHAHPAFGYRRLTAVLRRQGWRVKATRGFRLYRQREPQKPVSKKGRRGVKLEAELFHTLAEAQTKVATWLVWYKGERPHQGLGYATPREWWEAAPPGAPESDGPPPPAGRPTERRHGGLKPALS
jgi:transposase InsO family protein